MLQFTSEAMDALSLVVLCQGSLLCGDGALAGFSYAIISARDWSKTDLWLVRTSAH